MLYLLLGCVGFVFFFLYDINSIVMKNRLLENTFFVGMVLLIAATSGIIIPSIIKQEISWGKLLVYGAVSILFFILLTYTLFFALPFKDTYLVHDSLPKVCQNGVYALCRHPGVLWFTGFYVFLALALNIPLLMTAAVLFTILNILYVIFQDNWTFMKSFSNYGEYKKCTPFLLPDFKSMKLCFQTLKGKEELQT